VTKKLENFTSYLRKKINFLIGFSVEAIDFTQEVRGATAQRLLNKN